MVEGAVEEHTPRAEGVQFGSSDPLRSDGAPEQTMSSLGLSLIVFVFIFGGVIVELARRHDLALRQLRRHYSPQRQLLPVPQLRQQHGVLVT